MPSVTPTKARIKQEQRRSQMILLGGIQFSKDEWTVVPPEKLHEAKTSFSDILEFDTIAPSEAPPPPQAMGELEEVSEQEEVPTEEEETQLEEEAPKKSSRRKRKPKTIGDDE